jgi:hypothetical protein
MWLPNPVYERVPQFWILIALLFFSAGMYIGFEYVLTMYYVGLGFICCGYGLGIFMLRLRHRQGRKENGHSIGIAE